jgi:dihydropteroate synthase
MGVLNVTPDSFSDGGLYDTFERAVAHGLEMVAEGADVIDVGGESSRPGAEPVPVEVELGRVVPVVEALAREIRAARVHTDVHTPHHPIPTPGAPPKVPVAVRISVDTVKREVAEAALAVGATLLNDISASLHEVAAAAGAGWVGMHMQGEPRTMQADPQYGDVVAEVHDFLLERARRALEAGVGEVWVDPGIGFGKTPAHNLSLLHHLGELAEAAARLGCAGVVVGTSRKRFVGLLANPGGPDPAPMADRVEGSLATAAAALVAGARMVRVHDVAATVQMARLYGPAA